MVMDQHSVRHVPSPAGIAPAASVCCFLNTALLSEQTWERRRGYAIGARLRLCQRSNGGEDSGCCACMPRIDSPGGERPA